MLPIEMKNDAPIVPTSVGCPVPANGFLEFAKEEIEQSIPERFEKLAAGHPERIAIKTNDCTLTYRELDEAANRLAHAILAESERSVEPVALLFANGARFVAASVGAMKAGAIQVPLESKFPKARLRYILGQSGTRIVVTDDANVRLARELTSLPLINIDEFDAALSPESPRLRLSPDANVAIGYTSGSTGEPKGIVWNHRAMLHAVMRHTNRYRICATDRIAMFRAAVRPPLYALLNGATYYPIDLPATAPADLCDWLRCEEVTVLRAAVSVFRRFAAALTGDEAFPRLRLILLFGEALYRTDVELYRKHFADTPILGTSLGCNEFDDYACSFLNKESPLPSGAIPGGYPLADVEVLIVDEAARPVGVDQVGEIVIRSRYNAVGYWRSPDLTQAAFVPDPDGGPESLYHTGDLGRRGSDGCLFHLGRKDFQIKIRGHRVDASEIEAALLEIDGVRETVVTGRAAKPDAQRLAGYVVWTGAHPPSVSALRRRLSDKLPDYMVPSVFMFVDRLPLTATGKVDRRALPPPDGTRPALDTPFVAPRTTMERSVAAIWAEVLALDSVGIHDGFVELGGDSLLATHVVSEVTSRLRVTLPPHVLLDAATVAEMAARLDGTRNDSAKLRAMPPVRPALRLTDRGPATEIAPHPDSLWAVTSYFNPVGYVSRLENYRIFREHLQVPLVAVELSFNGHFELGRQDADILVQLSGRHVMWQKERLLNIGIERVPAACDKIAWLDCDIVFGGNEWVREAIKALDESALVHLFRERHDLNRGDAVEQLTAWSRPATSQSVAFRIAKGESVPEDFYLANAPVTRRTTAGLAWASRRDVLRRHGLYDACVLGSGDRAILCAALGKLEYGARALAMNPRRIDHYRSWAQPYFETVRGRVGYVDGCLFHLWHGDLVHRQYEARHRAFARFDFDPFEDISLAHNGCWRWNSNKSELHAFVNAYFESRREGGD